MLKNLYNLTDDKLQKLIDFALIQLYQILLRKQLLLRVTVKKFPFLWQQKSILESNLFLCKHS